MALNNRMVHKVFRTIAYTTRIDFEVIFLIEDINVINDLPVPVQYSTVPDRISITGTYLAVYNNCNSRERFKHNMLRVLLEEQLKLDL
jgi:hypothetical protein